MKRNLLTLSALAVICLPAVMWAIPQQIGGFANNIMEEEKWDRPPNYEEWRLDGGGRDGRAPGAADPQPNLWVNTKPVDIFGIPAPVGAARLKADDRWHSVAVRLPKSEKDQFHLLKSTLEAETGKEIPVIGKKDAGRGLVAVVNHLKLDVHELPDGNLDVLITRSAAGTKVSAR